MTNREFEQLIIQHKDKLFRFAFSILKNGDDAQDAVQEVVLKLWKNRSSLDRSKNLESYCLNAVKNYCFDVLRKQKQQQFYEQNILIDAATEPEIYQVDLVEKLKQELYRLPDQQRLAVSLKDIEGFDYTEISEILGQNVETIRVNVSRGRKKLYELFKEELKDAYQ